MSRGGSKQRRSFRVTPLAGTGIAAFVLVLAFVGYAGYSNLGTTDSAADYSSTYVAPMTTPPPKATIAAFIGDSYTQGAGATPESKRWSTVLSGQLGWTEKNFGRGGTGYLATGTSAGCGLPECPNYRAMITDVVAAQPDVVVVAGGQNDFADFQSDAASEVAAIEATHAELRQQLPTVRIIAVGPSTPSTVTDAVRGVDAAVRESAAKIGAQYISLLDPTDVVEQKYLVADGQHVDNDGHEAIAARLRAAINR